MRFDVLALALIVAPVVRAFSILDGGRSTSSTSSTRRTAPQHSASSGLCSPGLDALHATADATGSRRHVAADSRRAFLRQLTRGTTAAGLSLLAVQPPPRPAQAIVTAPTLDPSIALRTVKSSLRRLRGEAFADYVAFNEYESLRRALRDSPFSELRKSCTSLIRTAQGGETGGAALSVDAEQATLSPVADDLSSKYKAFIASLERMDATASVATRGRQLEPGELNAAYTDTVTSLEAFLNAAQDAVATSMPQRPDSNESA